MKARIYITGLLIFLLGCAKDPGSSIKLPVEDLAYKVHPSNTSYPVKKSLLNKSGTAVKSFYESHGNITLWTDEGSRKAFLLSVKEAEADGLNPKDYNHRRLLKYESDKVLTKKECMAYDILLTQSFFKLSNHLFKGKVAASSIYPDWALQQKKLDSGVLLDEALREHNISQVLDRCRPPHAVYAGLKKSLEFIRSLPDDSDFEKIAVTESIRLNDSVPALTAIKKRLSYWGDLKSNDTSALYTKETRKAIKRFQARHGIYPDGVIGQSTVQTLNITREQREEQILVNLERWRWFAYDFGTNAIVINIPDYMLAFVEENDTIAMHKVVVGKPDRRTPVLQSKLNYLVINPTWTVPPTILVEDLTPKATEDRNYFAEHNMKIYDVDSNEVTPEEWIPEKAKSYRYVQGSGDNNALGNIKFNFNNPFSVYLHDTNHRENFKRSKRALSSGCVRVDKPFDLAEHILKQEDTVWKPEKIQELVTAGKTENIYLKKTNYVHQLYWTAWMDTNGLQFRNDIYNLDKALYNKLRN